MSETEDSGPVDRTVGRWYSVTRDGLACLCLDEANAREMAAQCDRDYPKHAPHKAMQLVDATELDRLRALLNRNGDKLDRLRAENERMRADAIRSLAAGGVLIRLDRGDGYEDVCDEIVAEDAMNGHWPSYEVLTPNAALSRRGAGHTEEPGEGSRSA